MYFGGILITKKCESENIDRKFVTFFHVNVESLTKHENTKAQKRRANSERIPFAVKEEFNIGNTSKLSGSSMEWIHLRIHLSLRGKNYFFDRKI
jgi:hypothetical protein